MFKRSHTTAMATGEAYRKRRKRVPEKSRRNRGTYRCARCTNIKKGHKCSFQMVQSCSMSTQTGAWGKAQAEVFVRPHGTLRSPKAAPAQTPKQPTPQTTAAAAIWAGSTTQAAASSPATWMGSITSAATTAPEIWRSSTTPAAATYPAAIPDIARSNEVAATAAQLIWVPFTSVVAATPAVSGSTTPAAAVAPVVWGSPAASDPDSRRPCQKAFLASMAVPVVTDSDFEDEFVAVWHENVPSESEVSVANTEDNLALPISEAAGAGNLTHLEHQQVFTLEGLLNIFEWMTEDSLDTEIDRAFKMENVELNLQGGAVQKQCIQRQSSQLTLLF